MADTVDSSLTLLGLLPYERPLSDYKASDIDDLSDIELMSRRPERPSLGEEAGVELYDGNITRWTDGTIAKAVSRPLAFSGDYVPEAYAMDLAFRHTTIPTPRLRRVVAPPQSGRKFLIFMDYVPGRQLAHVWPTMSLFAKLRVAFTLRRYIRQLRAIRHPRSAVPGPLGPGLEGVKGHSPVYGDIRPDRGPFHTYAAFSAFWNDRHRMGKMPNASQEEAAAVLEPFDDSGALVLTHGDLHMWNILVGDDGRLWLIDWGFAGFYPPWFEFAGLRWHDWCECTTNPQKADRLWSLCIPFICGPYYKQERWWRTMGLGLNYR